MPAAIPVDVERAAEMIRKMSPAWRLRGVRYQCVKVRSGAVRGGRAVFVWDNWADRPIHVHWYVSRRAVGGP